MDSSEESVTDSAPMDSPKETDTAPWIKSLLNPDVSGLLYVALLAALIGLIGMILYYFSSNENSKMDHDPEVPERRNSFSTVPQFRFSSTSDKDYENSIPDNINIDPSFLITPDVQRRSPLITPESRASHYKSAVSQIQSATSHYVSAMSEPFSASRHYETAMMQPNSSDLVHLTPSSASQQTIHPESVKTHHKSSGHRSRPESVMTHPNSLEDKNHPESVLTRPNSFDFSIDSVSFANQFLLCSSALARHTSHKEEGDM